MTIGNGRVSAPNGTAVATVGNGRESGVGEGVAVGSGVATGRLAQAAVNKAVTRISVK